MQTTLKIEGMSCEHCVTHVTQALEGINGVRSAKISLEHHKAEVEHDDTVSPEAMKAAVIDAGYEIGE
jgi:copper ion binding protein